MKQITLLFFMFLTQINYINSFRIVGWFVNNGKDIDPSFTPENFNWSIYNEL